MQHSSGTALKCIYRRTSPGLSAASPSRPHGSGWSSLEPFERVPAALCDIAVTSTLKLPQRQGPSPVFRR